MFLSKRYCRRFDWMPIEGVVGRFVDLAAVHDWQHRISFVPEAVPEPAAATLRDVPGLASHDLRLRPGSSRPGLIFASELRFCAEVDCYGVTLQAQPMRTVRISESGYILGTAGANLGGPHDLPKIMTRLICASLGASNAAHAIRSSLAQFGFAGFDTEVAERVYERAVGARGRGIPVSHDRAWLRQFG